MKTIKGLIRKFNAARESRKNFKKELSPLQQKRIPKCKVCPFNLDNKKTKTIKDYFYIYLNKFLDFLYGIEVSDEAVCTDCGCNILHKTTQTEKDLICQKNYWNEDNE